MKRNLFTKMLALLLISVMTFTGCSSGGSKSAGGNSDGSKGKLNTTIEYWNINNETFGGPAVASLIDEFNKTNQSGITVKNRFISDGYGTVITNLLASVASKEYPGVIQMNYSNVQYISENFPYVSPEKLVSKYYPGDANYISSNFSKSILDLGRDGSGNLVGVPYSISNPIMFINEDLFTKAGLDPKKDVPTTWDKVYEVAKIIHEKTGAYGFYLQQATDNWAQQAMMESAGCKLLTYTNGTPKATFNNEKVVSAYSLLGKMYTEGISPNIAESDGQAALAAGKVAMHIMTCGRYSWAAQNLKFKWSTAKFPTFQGQKASIPCGGNVLLIVADSKEKQEACWEFMKFLYEPKNLKLWTEGTGYLPPRNGVADNELKDFYTKNTQLKPALDQMKDSVPWTSWPGKNGLEINQIMINLRDSIIASGGKSASTDIAKAESDVNKLLNKK